MILPADLKELQDPFGRLERTTIVPSEK